MSGSRSHVFWQSYRGWIARALVLAFTLAPTSVDADDAAQARFHDQRARQHFARGDYDAAVREFFLEQRVVENPRVTYNIALCFQQLNMDPEAFTYFEEYLASDDDDAERRAVAQRAVEQLASQVARLRVTSSPPGADVFIDDRAHGSYGVTPVVAVVAAGSHEVTVRREGYTAETRTVQAAQGAEATEDFSLTQIVGTLAVACECEGRVSVIDASGATVASGSLPFRQEVPPGDYELMLRATRFAPWRGLARVTANETTSEMIDANALPAATASMTVTGNETGSVILVDDEEVGFTPAVVPNLTVGPHTLEVRAEGRVPWRGEVDLRSGERSWVTATLQPPPYVTRNPVTWALGGIGIATLGAGIGVAVASRNNHDNFLLAEMNGEATVDLVRRGPRLNRAADILLGVGLVSLTASIVLFFTTKEVVSRPSEGTVSRSPEP